LHYDSRFVPDDLTFADDLFETFDSASIALAAGLITALQGLEPNLSAFSSAAWDVDCGIGSVEGLLEKCRTASDLGATDFFVPAWQKQDLLKQIEANKIEVNIHGLASGVDPGQLWPAVQAVLEVFARVPAAPTSVDDEEAFKTCVRYFLNLPARSERQNQFYQTHLFRIIAARCRDKIFSDHQNIGLTHLVTIASGGKDVTLLTILSTGVERVLLLHSDDSEQRKVALEIANQLDTQRSIFKQSGFRVPEVEKVAFQDDSQIVAHLQQSIGSFVKGIEPQQVIFDLKPGTKRMTYAIVRNAQSGNWLYDFRQKFTNNLPHPGTEQPELWQWE